MLRLRFPALLLLAALPGAASAACNPVDTEDCCTKDVTVACDSVTWPTAEGASAELGCGEVEFTLDGVKNGTWSATKTTSWTPNDPDTDCPDPQVEPLGGPVVPDIAWKIFRNGLKIGEGGGPSALATNVSGGTVRCVFTMTSETEWCGEDAKTYETSTNLPSATLVLPEIVGRNDLVEPCEDPTDRVSGVEELAEDEDDLYTLSWSVSPEADEVTIFSETADKLRLLVADGSRLATTYHHPPMPKESGIRLEGIRRSDETNDCTVTMAYRVGDLLCEISATTTVVSVELDKFCYNRMDPHPEVHITNVVNLVPGGTATAWCAVSPDVVESDPDGFSQTFSVASAPGTYAFRTREVQNRFGNKGWDVLRYTVYCDGDGAKRLAAGVATPSHDAVETPPPECLATVMMGDAFASTPEEALGHLASDPAIQAARAEGTKPDYAVPGIKLFKKAAYSWNANEMHLAELGATALREVLWGETQDTAVGLELTVPGVVAVNDRHDAGDPGKNAAIDLDPSDPDFSPPLSVEGIPGCVVTGTVSWAVSGGARLVAQKDGEMIVGSALAFPYPGAPTPRLEGRTASEEKNDVSVTFELRCAAVPENPAAFRGQTLRAVARTTVVDTRWTHHRPDGAGKSGKRHDLLECDLDLRPSVRIDSFGARPGGPFVVEGTVVSMIDLPTDVRVNGTPVAATNLLVGGRTAAEALAGGTWGLEPPYEVSFRHEMPSFAGETLEVAAFGSVSAHPGFHRFRGLGSGATNGVRSPVLASPTMTGFYGDFLYKFEADHAGSGLGFLDCAEGLRCGAQSTNLPLYRLERTLLFLPPDATGPGGTRTEGFQVEETPSGAPARGAYTALGLDDDSSATSISAVFPCDLDVKGGDGIVVPDCDEWWLGAFTEPGKTATLVVGDALGTPGIPTNGVATLSKTSDIGGVFPDFQTLTWRCGEPPPSAEDLVLTAAAPGIATFEFRLSGEELASWDRVKITSLLVDADVDSDNDNGFDAPSRSDAEDEVEDTIGKPGKLVFVDDCDSDEDGIPDFADGYGLFDDPEFATSGCDRFVPLVIEISKGASLDNLTLKLEYDDSSPFAVSVDDDGEFLLPPGKFRLWSKRGTEARNRSDFIPSGAYSPFDLGFSEETRTKTFFLEAVSPSAGMGTDQVAVSLHSASGSGASVCSDQVVVTAFSFELDNLARDDDGQDFISSTEILVSHPVPHVEATIANPVLTGNELSLTLVGSVSDSLSEYCEPGNRLQSFDVLFAGDVVATIPLGYSPTDDGFRTCDSKTDFSIPLTLHPVFPGANMIHLVSTENAAGEVGRAAVGVFVSERGIENLPDFQSVATIRFDTEVSTNAVNTGSVDFAGATNAIVECLAPFPDVAYTGIVSVAISSQLATSPETNDCFRACLQWVENAETNRCFAYFKGTCPTSLVFAAANFYTNECRREIYIERSLLGESTTEGYVLPFRTRFRSSLSTGETKELIDAGLISIGKDGIVFQLADSDGTLFLSTDGKTPDVFVGMSRSCPAENDRRLVRESFVAVVTEGIGEEVARLETDLYDLNEEESGTDLRAAKAPRRVAKEKAKNREWTVDDAWNMFEVLFGDAGAKVRKAYTSFGGRVEKRETPGLTRHAYVRENFSCWANDPPLVILDDDMDNAVEAALALHDAIQPLKSLVWGRYDFRAHVIDDMLSSLEEDEEAYEEYKAFWVSGYNEIVDTVQTVTVGVELGISIASTPTAIVVDISNIADDLSERKYASAVANAVLSCVGSFGHGKKAIQIKYSESKTVSLADDLGRFAYLTKKVPLRDRPIIVQSLRRDLEAGRIERWEIEELYKRGILKGPGKPYSVLKKFCRTIGPEVAKVERHHDLPLRFERKIIASGVDPNTLGTKMPKEWHRVLHRGGGRGGIYNKQWEEFFRYSDDFYYEVDPSDIFHFNPKNPAESVTQFAEHLRTIYAEYFTSAKPPYDWKDILWPHK